MIEPPNAHGPKFFEPPAMNPFHHNPNAQEPKPPTTEAKPLLADTVRIKPPIRTAPETQPLFTGAPFDAVRMPVTGSDGLHAYDPAREPADVNAAAAVGSGPVPATPVETASTRADTADDEPIVELPFDTSEPEDRKRAKRPSKHGH